MDAPPVQYVKTSDGYDIAYCVSGEGPPLVLMPLPINHLHLYWTENTWYREWLVALSSRFKLVQYDSRGQGLSSRGLRPEIAWDDFGQDLKAVIDDALGLDNNINRVRALGYLAQVAVTLLEKGEMEERLQAVEAALGPRMVKTSSRR